MIVPIICILAIAAAVGLPIYSAIKKSRTTSASSASSTTSTSTPVAVTKSYGWVWAIVGVLAIVVVIWVIAPMMTKSITPAQPPVAKRELKQRVDRRELRLVGGDGTFERNTLTGIRGNTLSYFMTGDMPWRKDAQYHVGFQVIRKTTGQICIEINGRSGQIFHLVPGDPNGRRVQTAVFFESGMPGDSKYFNPNGINQIIFQSIGDDAIVLRAFVEMIYRE